MASSRPTSSKQARATPAAEAMPPVGPADWHALVLLHHQSIRSAFARALAAPAGGSRLTAFKGLASLLNGHSLAEEIVLYPVLADDNAKSADKVYLEQSHAKVEMAMLEQLDPASDSWAGKLSEIRDAVEAHMADEESRWFADIKASGVNQAKLTARYREEFDRYTRTGMIATNGAWDGHPLRAT